MHKLTTTLVATAIVGAVGFTSLAPAFAQDVADNRGGDNRRAERMAPRGGHAGPGGFIRLICSDEGATRLETTLSTAGEKIDLTAEQQAAFDNLKTATLTAQTEFADECTAPVTDADDDTDLVDRMKIRQANMQAYLEAMDDVVPVLETFYDSLTEEQKADLLPQRGEGPRGRHGMKHGEHRGGPDAGPRTPEAPEAPEAANG